MLLALGSVWLGVTNGLRPLRRLSADVAARSASALDPLRLDGVPHEAGPMVAAVNDLMLRLNDTLAHQARFIADASHALRTPLAVLRSEADLALRKPDDAGLRAAVVVLREHIQSISHLASQLLLLARVGRRDTGPSRSLDLAALARDACAGLVPAALERGVDLGYSGEESLQILGREPELREAVVNLVDNSLRYGRQGGVITVSVARREGLAVLAVEDDGPGVPPSSRAAVLEPFHRLAGSPGEGSGLGLAIVREIAEHHGALLVLGDAEGGRGLRVEVRLPAAKAPEAPAANGA
jgi:two-component system sensor histidine kinase TctE